MSTDNLTAFTEAVAADPALAGRVQTIHADASRMIAESLAALSERTGTPFTAEAYCQHLSAQAAELSDEQLDAVAGGAWDASAGNICASIFTLGAVCGVMAFFSATTGRYGGLDNCQIQTNEP